jgi:hypothetical protein
MRNNYSTLTNTYNIKKVNQTYTYTDPVCTGTDRSSCSYNGVCLNGACVCDSKFWSGDKCQIPFCTDRPSCSGHGECTNGMCICDELWSGDRCEKPQCTADPDCLNGGKCMQGQCYCNDRFYGDNCQLIDYSVPPCDGNKGWVLNESLNTCVYKCTKDGQYPSNPDNNNNNAYKYVPPPVGSQGAGACYRIFDQLDHDSRYAACHTNFAPWNMGCFYWQGSPAVHKWKTQDWVSDSVDDCPGTAWPTCSLNIKNKNIVTAVNNNPIDYYNPVNQIDPESGDITGIKWGAANEKGIGSDDGMDVSIPYPSIPTSYQVV